MCYFHQLVCTYKVTSSCSNLKPALWAQIEQLPPGVNRQIANLDIRVSAPRVPHLVHSHRYRFHISHTALPRVMASVWSVPVASSTKVPEVAAISRTTSSMCAKATGLCSRAFHRRASRNIRTSRSASTFARVEANRGRHVHPVVPFSSRFLLRPRIRILQVFARFRQIERCILLRLGNIERLAGDSASALFVARLAWVA
jgi:hypothetical protein